MAENQRKAFRIRYKEKDMPVLEIKDKKYPLIDISVIGLKLWGSNDFYEFQSLEGKIQLHTGELNFKGTVIRVNKNSDCIAIEINPELSLGKLYLERNYLKEKGYKI